jgi:cell division ATPase FtsA
MEDIVVGIDVGTTKVYTPMARASRLPDVKCI